MKSLIKISSVLFTLLLTATLAFANNVEPNFTVKVSGEKTINFNAKDMLSNTFEVSFQNSEGAIIFSEYVTTPATFERNYNLSELPTGSYFLVIIGDVQTQTLPILIQEDGLTIEMEAIVSVP